MKAPPTTSPKKQIPSSSSKYILTISLLLLLSPIGFGKVVDAPQTIEQPRKVQNFLVDTLHDLEKSVKSSEAIFTVRNPIFLSRTKRGLLYQVEVHKVIKGKLPGKLIYSVLNPMNKTSEYLVFKKDINIKSSRDNTTLTPIPVYHSYHSQNKEKWSHIDHVLFIFKEHKKVLQHFLANLTKAIDSVSPKKP